MPAAFFLRRLSFMKYFSSALLRWWLVLCLVAPAFAATDAVSESKLIPVEHFARQPSLRAIQFSPDGKWLAALESYRGRMNITTVEVATGVHYHATEYTDFDVGAGYQWVSSKRLVFSLIDTKAALGVRHGGGLFAVNVDGSEGKVLRPTSLICSREWAAGCVRWISPLRRLPGAADEMLVMANDRSARSADLYRMNTRTGRMTLVTTENPGNVIRWVTDYDGTPRAALSADGLAMRNTFWYRDSAETPWQQVASFDTYEPQFEPLVMTKDGTLYVASNLESDKMGIYKFDPKTRRPGEKVIAHSLVDLDYPGILQLNEERELVGFQFEADKPGAYWVNPHYARVQATLDRALGEGVELLDVFDDGRVLALQASDRDPGTYYLYDEHKKQVHELYRPRDWIKPEQMGSTRVVRYKARDALEVPGYLTIPAGKEAHDLPLVVWVHGGPWARDDWGWNSYVQFFASRGYAVFQPNYRGSEGFGLKHMTSSFKKLGQAMQDDVTDGVRYLVSEGIVDAKRICIGGGSYGGYATMMGLIREPDLFRCGIDYVGVVDLQWWIDIGYTDFNSQSRYGVNAAEVHLKRAIGDPSKDLTMMEANSPRLHAEKVKAAVLIVHGGLDRRVPIVHGEAMRDALRKAGKPVEWLVYSDEAHGVVKPENIADMFSHWETFLATHIGH